MLFNLHSDINVSRDNIRVLVAFSCENVIVFIWAACFDGNFEFLLYFFYFFPFAFLASVFLFHYFASPFTVSTFLGSLGVHAGAELNKLLHCTTTLTFTAFLNIFASFAITGLTVAGPFDFDFLHAAEEYLL